MCRSSLLRCGGLLVASKVVVAKPSRGGRRGLSARRCGGACAGATVGAPSDPCGPSGPVRPADGANSGAVVQDRDLAPRGARTRARTRARIRTEGQPASNVREACRTRPATAQCARVPMECLALVTGDKRRPVLDGGEVSKDEIDLRITRIPYLSVGFPPRRQRVRCRRGSDAAVGEEVLGWLGAVDPGGRFPSYGPCSAVPSGTRSRLDRHDDSVTDAHVRADISTSTTRYDRARQIERDHVGHPSRSASGGEDGPRGHAGRRNR